MQVAVGYNRTTCRVLWGMSGEPRWPVGRGKAAHTPGRPNARSAAGVDKAAFAIKAACQLCARGAGRQKGGREGVTARLC